MCIQQMQSDLLMFIQLGQSCATAIDKETFQGNSIPVTGLQNKALPMTGRVFASKPTAGSGLHARVNVSAVGMALKAQTPNATLGR